MGRPIHEAYGAMERRETLFFFDPFKLHIVGLDGKAGDSPLADPDRVALDYDEAMVQSIMALGNITPVSMRRDGNKPDGSPHVEVVVGRGRVMGCREAWRRMRKAGVAEEDLPPVMAIKSRGEAQDLIAIMIAENMIRRQETPLSAARKAAKLYALSRDKRRTALVCGVSAQTLDTWFALLELSPAVLKLVESGQVSATQAVALLKGVPSQDQLERISALISEGKVKGLAAESEVKRAKRASRGPDAEDDGSEEGDDDEDPPVLRAAASSLPPKRSLRRFRAAFKAAPRDQTFSTKQVGNLVDFILDGEPLKGPMRALWASAEKAAAAK